MPATVLQTQKQFYSTSVQKKNYTQTVTIALGCLLILIGLSGMLNDEFMGPHLPIMHSFVLTGSGALAIWAASQNRGRNAYYVGVGYEGRDQMLVKYAPGFIELGTVDHFLHAFLAVFFITGALSWKLHHHATRVHKT